jgi:CBS domain-containing protein
MEATSPVSQILAAKPAVVHTVPPSGTVFEAISLMAKHNIGALLVLEDGRVEGVFSERDYTRKLILQGRTSRETFVRDVLSRPAVTVTPDTTIAECMRLMTDNRIRHLPVVDQGRPLGVVSIGDCVKWVISAQTAHIEHLERYIQGDYPG